MGVLEEEVLIFFIHKIKQSLFITVMHLVELLLDGHLLGGAGGNGSVTIGHIINGNFIKN